MKCLSVFETTAPSCARLWKWIIPFSFQLKSVQQNQQSGLCCHKACCADQSGIKRVWFFTSHLCYIYVTHYVNSFYFVNFIINIKSHSKKKHILLWSWNKVLPLDQILRRQMFYFWMTCTIRPGMCIWKGKKNVCMDGIWKKLTCNRLLHNLYCVFICSILCRVSAPEQVFLPIANWQPKDKPVLEDDIGPLVQHIYEVINAVNIIGQRH